MYQDVTTKDAKDILRKNDTHMHYRLSSYKLMECWLVSESEYVLPLQVNELFFLASKIPLANPNTIVALPKGANNAYLTPKESPILASIVLPR